MQVYITKYKKEKKSKISHLQKGSFDIRKFGDVVMPDLRVSSDLQYRIKQIYKNYNNTINSIKPQESHPTYFGCEFGPEND